MRIFVCGVRGSTPAPGDRFVRYGGHTSCVALAHDDDDAPTLVIDAGTGLQNLSELLDGRDFRGSMVLGHLHWDHVLGIPFFKAGDRATSRVDLYIPEQGDPEEVLSGVMGPPHFPIKPAQLRGSWKFFGLEPGPHVIEGFDVVAREIPHPGGRTYGFRVSDGNATIAYLSDHWPTSLGPGPDGLGAYHDSALALARDVDVLIHDAQYLIEEMAEKEPFGHCSVEYALGLAHAAGAKKLLLFHHEPRRTDDEVDAILLRLRSETVEIAAAHEGMRLQLPALSAR